MKNFRLLRLGQTEHSNPVKFRRARQAIKKLLPLLIVVGILISIAIFLTTWSGTNSYVSSIVSGTVFKNADDRVNILLLGIAGGTHEGPTLTDTIMVVSYLPKTDQIYLFSIPRDLWLPSLKGKANTVYEIGRSQGDGLGLAKTVMGNILGLPIQHALRIDFSGFIQAIDTLGGIDVMVDQTFDDYNYPIQGKEDDLCGYTEAEIDFSADEAKQLNIEPGKLRVFIAPDGSIATDSAKEDLGAKYFTCRYEHIHFDKGLARLDGLTALKFVRSRHGTNEEASDFARSKRQEKVLDAVRSKALSLETLIDPAKISQLLETFGRSIDTDINVKNVVELYKLLRRVNKIRSFVLDDSVKSGLPDSRKSLLVHPPREEYGGAYVLISQDDDFSVIQGYVKKLLTGEITDGDATAAARISN